TARNDPRWRAPSTRRGRRVRQKTRSLTVRRAFELLHNARFQAPMACAAAVAQIRTRSGLDLSKARVRAGFARGHLLDIVVYVPGGKGTADETEQAEELVRLLVGEESFERWVGSVSATPSARGGPLTVINSNAQERSASPVHTLPETVHAAIAGLKLGLSPLAPSVSSDSDAWVAFELEPEPAPDFAAQDDLVLCSTRLPELKKSFLRGEPFFSGRFLNSGALFTYLKFEFSGPNPEAWLAERTRLEEAALRAVHPEQAALVGLGLGIRYGYLDFAVSDPDCVSERLLPALRAANIAQRSWFLFCDSELEREFIAVHPNASAPLLAGVA
ncbi:MAG: hypothetical protein ABI488_00990, partial [Polyangiaceae bacterium]